MQGNPWSAQIEESPSVAVQRMGRGGGVWGSVGRGGRSVRRLLGSPGEQPPALPSRWANIFIVPLLSCLSLELGNHA